ncbi:MAG TPA: SHOCT domain-containing protein, partial [Rhodocyclaceae bacterium]
GDNRKVNVLAYVQASVKPIQILYHSVDSVLPQICAEKKSAVFQDLYKSFTSRRKPKCLTIERINLQSLSDAEHAALDKHSLSFSSGPMIRLTMATSDGRYGTLALAFTSTISADEEEAYIESLKKWGHQYVTSQLEDSLSRSLWEAPFKDPYPITVTGANPTSTAPVTQPAGAQPAPSSDDVFSMLEKLKSLHEQGILTDQEFNSKKAELLKRL